MSERPHKIMTPEEYAALNIKGWHRVCKDVDGFGAVGVIYEPQPEETRRTAGYGGGEMTARIETLLCWLTGGRPMIYQGYAFRDVVSGKAVHYWVDHYGRHWMAEHKWARFRVERRC